MKTKYPSLFGLLVALMLVASFVVPSNFLSPKAAEADPGICKWDTLVTPGAFVGKNDVVLCNDPIDLEVGGDGRTVLVVDKYPALPITGGFAYLNMLLYSSNGGIAFSTTRSPSTTNASGWVSGTMVYDVAIAPDNPNFWAITTDLTPCSGPKNVWVTTNAGSKWENTNLTLGLNETIRAIDISVDYGGRRDIAVATVTGGGGGKVYVVQSTGFGGWKVQDDTSGGSVAPPANVDYFALKFSPTYPSDASMALVFADAGGTYFNIAQRDIDKNITLGYYVDQTGTPPGIPLPPATALGTKVAPNLSTLNKADLELPSDFSGQAASLRRAYISLDAFTGTTWDGIVRVDDTTVYVLMDTSGDIWKSIYSIAYYGTYASGKLLAGERMGYPCEASVPTWFTDSPTVCPIPCWYPCLKCPTGAACGGDCGADTCKAGAHDGLGNAIVAWGLNGQIATAVTSSAPVGTGATWFYNLQPQNVLAGSILCPTGKDPCCNDESAFSISRNNGETWNQLALIDTRIDYFSDIAPSSDCKTIYLASINYGNEWESEVEYNCCGFDSVWRTSANAEVVAPYPPLPAGTMWERVFTHVTAASCNKCETEAAILRLVPYCQDPTGQIVAWAVYDGTETCGDYCGGMPERVCADRTSGVAYWSPDYGDYWASITVRNKIQDFAFESKTVMYFLSPTGLVQKMPYTGTAWATTLPSVDTTLPTTHTIAAYPEGKVLVGAEEDTHLVSYAVAYSSNFNTDAPSFTVQTTAGRTVHMGNVHVAFHPNFKENSLYYIGDNAGLDGSVYRNNPTAQQRWVDVNMMDAMNGAVGCPTPDEPGIYGVAVSNSGEALYAAGWGPIGWDPVAGPCQEPEEQCIRDCFEDVFGVWRTLDLLEGMPKPGIAWDFLWVGLQIGRFDDKWPDFTLEPSSLKLCGCCDATTDTVLWAIDNESCGKFWNWCSLPPESKYGSFAPLRGVPWKDSDTGYSPCQNRGMVWAFTDCMAKKGPKLVTADKTLIGCDPVSGRAAEVNLCWEQLCVADAYDIEIAKNADFSIRVIDWASDGECLALSPVDVLKPCAYFPAGGLTPGSGSMLIGGYGTANVGAAGYSLPSIDFSGTGRVTMASGSALALFGNLECGHTYYWRVKVRHCATGQWISSPWSEVRSFSVKAGVPIVGTSMGLQLLSPANGAMGVPVNKPSFSWSPLGEVGKYKFILAKDAALTQVVKEAEVSGSTAYTYDGKLDYDTNYFWQVRGLEPATDPSAVFSFRTEQAPPPPPEPEKPVPTPLWVWVLIAIGAILVIVTLVLIFKTRRV